MHLQNSYKQKKIPETTSVRCKLNDSIAYTGVGHATDRAIILGLHGYLPEHLIDTDIDRLMEKLQDNSSISFEKGQCVDFDSQNDIFFDKTNTLSQHPNGMEFEWLDTNKNTLLKQTYFSIGGGFIIKLEDIKQLIAPIVSKSSPICPYPFDSANQMLSMSDQHDLSIAQMKRLNETQTLSESSLDQGLNNIWKAMQLCVERGLKNEGILPGGLNTPRRAKNLHQQLKQSTEQTDVNDWLCTYAMAVNEENAAGSMVVTAPTNGAAGIIPAILYYLVNHQKANIQQVRDFLLTASAIGGLIKHRSSISGAEVGCQGEIGSASSMAAAGLCAAKGGSSAQIENAAEIALEHHLGLTCDPVQGLVQVPCIERNGFGAISAYLAASIALKETGKHLISLDHCIETMKKTGFDMSNKYKETSLGGLALSMTEC